MQLLIHLMFFLTFIFKSSWLLLCILHTFGQRCLSAVFLLNICNTLFMSQTYSFFCWTYYAQLKLLGFFQPTVTTASCIPGFLVFFLSFIILFFFLMGTLPVFLPVCHTHAISLLFYRGLCPLMKTIMRLIIGHNKKVVPCQTAIEILYIKYVKNNMFVCGFFLI